MADEATTTAPAEGDTTATTDSTSTVDSTATTTTTGSEAEIDTGSKEEAQVPSHVLREANEAKRAAEEEARIAREELATLKEEQTKSSQTDEEIDPDTLDVVKRSAKNLGLVSKEELDAREAEIQVRQDIADLTSQYKDSGIAFDGKSIIDYAKANGIQITSKKSLDAVYLEMNREAIIEAERKAAVAAHEEAAKSGAEKPGSGGDKKPSEEPKPGNLKERIRSAREKLGVQIT